MLTVDVCVVIQVYHISRNLWSKLETRTVKNVCAPAAVIEEKIYIVGGERTSGHVEKALRALSQSLTYYNKLINELFVCVFTKK